jgi:hypothetical protein
MESATQGAIWLGARVTLVMPCRDGAAAASCVSVVGISRSQRA